MKKIFIKIFLFFQCLLGLGILLICLIPYTPLPYVAYLSIDATLFPYLLLINFLFIIFWLIVKPKFVLITLLFFIISWKQINSLIAIHPLHNFKFFKNSQKDIRIASWNIRGFNGNVNKNSLKEVKQNIVFTIEKYNPDIICFQEFNTNNVLNNQIALFKKKYPYHYFSKDYLGNNTMYQLGCIIFSKYKIVDSLKVNFPKAESLIKIDILHDLDTISIFTTHLQSFKLKSDDLNTIDDLTNTKKISFQNSKQLLKKLFVANKMRYVQSEIIVEQLKKSKHPFILTGDFNDVPNSFTYQNIYKNVGGDSFIESSFGIGTTYNSLFQTLRIDYILYDSHFISKQFALVDKDLSDHNLLIADLSLKK